MSATPREGHEPLTVEALAIDAERAAHTIVEALRAIVVDDLRRRGAVIGVSGGVDSAVTAALCARAFGPERCLAVLLPEADSDAQTRRLSRNTAEAIGIEAVEHDITPILHAIGCYRLREDAVREVIPELTSEWRWKLARPSILGSDAYRFFVVVAESPTGKTVEARLPAKTYATIVAATNFKQRVRKTLEYYHADRLHYAVAGTPNRLEYDQGFFVKAGDGAADVKPIAHLYKTQVYALAEYLELPQARVREIPTTDTFSLPQTQEEFYFSLPHEKMDLCLYAHNHGLAPEGIADAAGLSVDDVQRVFRDIDQKRRATRYLHLPPLLVAPVAEVPARPLRP